MTGYRTLEQHVQQVIEDALEIQVSPLERQQIKYADDLVAIFEHTVLREQQPWDPPRNIADCLYGGFVKGKYDALMTMAERVPVTWRWFTAFTPDVAEVQFLLRNMER
jgi:hypothetical protein